MLSVLRKLFRPRHGTNTRRRAPRGFRPQLEWLEDLTLPSTSTGLSLVYVNAADASARIQNGSQQHPFGTIQEGVNAAASGATIHVAAGTYAENVTISTPVTLLGPNATVDPNTHGRHAEAIVEPGLTSSYNTDSVFTVEASNVTIEGFTVQGSISGRVNANQSTGYKLSSGVTVYAAAGISNSTNVNNGATTNISGLTVENDVIKNFTQLGVYGDTTDGTVSTGNTIADNRISDVPENNYNSSTGTGYDGEGVVIYDNFYADVTGNTITDVRTGIQTGNNYSSSGNFAASISDNHVSAYVKGIYYNLQYESASPFTIKDNTITQQDGSMSPVYNVGLLIQSIQGSVSSDIVGNNVSGFLYGVEFAGNNTTSTVTLNGGILNNNTYGIWDTNNDYFYPAGYATTAAVQGVTITNSKDAGIWVDATSASSAGTYDTSDTATLMVGGGTTLRGNSVGLLVDGSGPASSGSGRTPFAIASLANSTVENNGTGILVENGGELMSATSNNIMSNSQYGVEVTFGSATLTANSILGNHVGILSAGSAATVNANDNWWGSNAGPASSGSDSAFALDGGTLNDSTWLVLNLDISSPTQNGSNETYTVTANLTENNDGQTVRRTTLPPLPVDFSASGGPIKPTSTVLMDGMATATFTTHVGTHFSVSARVGSQTDTVKETAVSPPPA